MRVASCWEPRNEAQHRLVTAVTVAVDWMDRTELITITRYSSSKKRCCLTFRLRRDFNHGDNNIARCWSRSTASIVRSVGISRYCVEQARAMTSCNISPHRTTCSLHAVSRRLRLFMIILFSFSFFVRQRLSGTGWCMGRGHVYGWMYGPKALLLPRKKV